MRVTGLGKVALCAVWMSACGGQAGAPEPVVAADVSTGDEQPRYEGLGGRLFDKWYAALDSDFEPDDAATPGVADGKGGPNGNGTLNDAQGAPLLNDGGHSYRLKSFFGWDLRGGEGIYGSAYQANAAVLPINLLSDALDRDAVTALLRDGGQGLPAYGQVLDADQLSALVDYVLATREARLPRPDKLWELSTEAPKNYVLMAGADAARGVQLVADHCAGCHGDDGTRKLFDGGAYSLGSHVRQKAYEDWFKVVSGHPGSRMRSQLPDGAQGEEAQAFVLDVLAALCDRTAFPKGAASKDDVPDGDLRCGAYLR